MPTEVLSHHGAVCKGQTVGSDPWQPCSHCLPSLPAQGRTWGDHPHSEMAQVPFSSSWSFPELLILYVKKAILKTRFISRMCLF